MLRPPAPTQACFKVGPSCFGALRGFAFGGTQVPTRFSCRYHWPEAEEAIKSKEGVEPCVNCGPGTLRGPWFVSERLRHRVLTPGSPTIADDATQMLASVSGGPTWEALEDLVEAIRDDRMEAALAGVEPSVILMDTHRAQGVEMVLRALRNIRLKKIPATTPATVEI